MDSQPRLPPLEAIIFDCDGVLFHSERANIEFFNSVLQTVGQPRLDAAGERLATEMAGSQLIEALFGHDRELAERATRAARSQDYGPYFAWMEPVAGLHDCLAGLRRNHRLAMASNRGMTVPQVVERFGLGTYLELAVGTLDVERPKPAPDMLLKCLSHFGVEPSRALFVGDTNTDWKAATAAGTHFVAIGERVDAPWKIRELRELPALLATPTDSAALARR